MVLLYMFSYYINRSRAPQVVPFRDSKLTRVLQGFFCGRGTSTMVVNINPCASIYDETLQALKFSAIATQVRNSLVHEYLSGWFSFPSCVRSTKCAVSLL